MSFRTVIEKLEKTQKIGKVSIPVSKKLEAAGIFYTDQSKPFLLEKIKESKFRVAGNVFATKQNVAEYFGVKTEQLIPKLTQAMQNPSKPEIVQQAACQEEEMNTVDLDQLPILFHFPQDGGNYVSSGVIIAKDKEFGQNMSFHRCMQIDKNKFAIRIVERHLHEFLKRNNGKLDVAFCIGNEINSLLAAAISTKIGVNELEIANSLEPLQVAKAKTSDILIPADCEFVLEGTIHANELHAEGPFVDLTETNDIVRQQPVFEVKKITHRKNAIWQALMPGSLEHKLLMGMPKEPTIFQEVNKVCKCLDVNINPGGCSWLHAIIKIDKQKEDDGKKAIEAAFKGHASLKHCFVVDKDIDILNLLEVEWAMATRFQGDTGLVLKGKEKGSSLDPSSDPVTKETTKIGFDLTAPLVAKGKDFSKVQFPKVDLKKYLK